MTRSTAGRRVTRAAAVALVLIAVWIVAAPEVAVTLGRSAAPSDGRGAAARESLGPMGPTGIPSDPGSPAGSAGTPPDATSGASTGIDAGAGPGPHVVEVRGAWRDAEDLGTAVALAVIVGGAHAAAEDPRGRAATVAVEAVEQPGPGAVVVTLLLAPPRTGSDADPGTATRLAVPLRVGPSGVRPGGTPWRLDGVALTPEPPQGRPIRDPDLITAARAALDAAGLDGAALRRLDATDGWAFTTWLAPDDTTTDAPADPSDPAAGGVPGPWLRWHVDRFVVAGLPLHRAVGRDGGPDPPEGRAGHG